MVPSRRVVCLCVLCAIYVCGCEGRTGEIGTPITERYDKQLSELEIGQSTPTDLRNAFGSHLSLKEDSVEGGTRVQIFQVFRGGDMDLGQFLLWGQIAHDQDQAIEFRFENNVLVSYQGVVYSDPQ